MGTTERISMMLDNHQDDHVHQNHIKSILQSDLLLVETEKQRIKLNVIPFTINEREKYLVAYRFEGKS
jgi:hypothetical protein